MDIANVASAYYAGNWATIVGIQSSRPVNLGHTAAVMHHHHGSLVACAPQLITHSLKLVRHGSLQVGAQHGGDHPGILAPPGQDFGRQDDNHAAQIALWILPLDELSYLLLMNRIGVAIDEADHEALSALIHEVA